MTHLPLLWGIAALAVLFACWGAATLRIDADEAQVLNAAWAMARGEQLYTAVWDNHGPLFPYALALLFKIHSPAGYGAVLALRLGMAAMLAASAWALAALARRAVPDVPEVPPLALALYFSAPVLVLKGTEIRCDNPMNLAWILVLLAWFRAWRTGRARGWFLAGLLLGVGFALSLKVVILGGALFLVFLTGMLLQRRVAVKPLLLCGAGGIIFPIFTLIFLKIAGNSTEFLRSYFGQNLDRARPPLGEGLQTLLEASTPGFLVLAAALAWCVVQVARRRAPDGVCLLLPPALLLVLQYLFLLPTHNLQSFVPALVPGMVLAGWAVADACRVLPEGAARTLAPAALALAIVVLLDHRSPALRNEFRRNTRFYEAQARAIPEGVPLLTGYGHPVFRPQPFIVKSFVDTIRERLRAGTMSLDFEGVLAAKGVAYVVYDRRIADLGDGLRSFLATAYLPLRENCVMAAGRVVTEAEKEKPVPVKIPGKYRWKIENNPGKLVVDGREAAEFLELSAGNHVFSWEGPGALCLCVAPLGDIGAIEPFLARGLPLVGDFVKAKKRKGLVMETWPGYFTP